MPITLATLSLLLALTTAAIAQETVSPGDPSARTIDQLRREIAALKETIFATIDGKVATLDIKLNALDKAMAERIASRPAEIQAAIDQIKALIESEHDGTQKQLDERNIRFDQAIAEVKISNLAALEAHEKTDEVQSAADALAVSKNETTTTKQIDGISELIRQSTAATDSKIDDLRARVQAIESRGEGQATQRQDINQVWGLVFGAVGMLIAIFTVAFTLITRKTGQVNA